MDIAQYKKAFGVQYRHIARKCRCTPEMISLIATGKTSPSFGMAVKIEQATNGHVGRENWYPPRPTDITITIRGISA